MPKGRCLILLIWLSLLFSDNVEKSERVDFKSAPRVPKAREASFKFAADFMKEYLVD